MTTMFTSDTHFWHENILKYCPGRRYDSIDAMNRDFIARWNARVGAGDTVYHLGDFALGQWEDAKPIFDQLAGAEKHLVLGNHDRTATQMRSMGWTSVGQELVLKQERILCQHHPQTLEKLSKRGFLMQLCGHVHESWSRANTKKVVDPDTGEAYVKAQPDPKGKVINVGVDVRAFAPVTLAELLASA
jgi:calcineurin-like phosphoesterase family protein